MLPVTFNGEDFYLLPYVPNWAQPFVGSFFIPVDIDLSQGGISARTPQGETLRESHAFQLTLKDQAAARFSVGLQRLGSKRLLCPFWPAAHRFISGEFPFLDPDGNPYVDPDGNPYTYTGYSTSPISSGIWFTYEPGFSSCEVHTDDAPAGFTPSAAAIRVPLLIGYYKADPDTDAITNTRLGGRIEFLESGPAQYALKPTPVGPPSGPSIGSREIPLLDRLINWVTKPKAGTAGINVSREQVGYGRELVVTTYPQNSVRRISATYLCRDWSAISALLSFFLQRKGQSESFWIPGLLSPCRLTAPTSSASAVIHVDDASLLGDNRYIAFTRAGLPSICRHVVSIDLGANTLALDSSPGDIGLGAYDLVNLILVRFAKPALDLSWSTDARATGRIDFVELPDEYFNPVGEVLGQTMGALPTRAWWYRFIREYPQETVVQRFTSFERDLFIDGDTYTKQPIEHDKIVDSSDPDQSTTTITARNFPGNPLALLFARALDVPLIVQIGRCDIQSDGTPTNPKLLFTGTVVRPSSLGPIITATARHRLEIVSQKVPVPVIQPECNWSFLSVPCGLNKNDWTWSTVLVAIAGNTLTLGTFARTNGGTTPPFGTGWFAFGRLWYGTTSADYGLSTIYNSTALASGELTVTLARSLLNAPAIGSTVYLRPGCNRSISWCREKYNNYENANGFGGLPFVPVGNPSFIINRSTANPTTQKK